MNDIQVELKTKIITELYNSGKLQEKLNGILSRHNLPMNADIQQDIIQTTFEHLWKYNTEKMIEAYNNNPNRILALGVTILLRKCILKDKRYANNKHSLSTYMLFGSSLVSENVSINENPAISDYFITHSDINENREIDYKRMWDDIYTQLDFEERTIIHNLLAKIKIPKKQKKDLIIKIRSLIKDKNDYLILNIYDAERTSTIGG